MRPRHSAGWPHRLLFTTIQWYNITMLIPNALDHLRAADPILAQLIEQVGPPQLQPTGHAFTTLAEAIIAQQITVKAAQTIAARLTEALGGTITPVALRDAPDVTLRAAGLSHQKQRYLRDLASHALAGALDSIPELADEEAIQALTMIHGIGRWTAEIYLLFALGRPDVLPAADLGLRLAAQQFYALPERPSAAQVLRLGEPWRPQRSLAAWYLWQARRLR